MTRRQARARALLDYCATVAPAYRTSAGAALIISQRTLGLFRFRHLGRVATTLPRGRK